MKKTYKYLIGSLVLLGGLFAHAAFAQAYVVFNNDALDKETLRVANVSQNTGWTTNVNANPGDTIEVDIYYHNNGDATANNTLFKLTPGNSSSNTNHTITGTVSAGNSSNTASGSVSISTSSSLTLNFINGSAKWYPNRAQNVAPFPYGQSGDELISGGLTIGSLAPGWSTQGHVTAYYRVGSTSQSCQITSFTTSNSNVNQNGTVTLSWVTTGVNTISISPNVNGNPSSVNSGNITTYPINGPTTFTLTATCANGQQVTSSVNVGINNSGQAPTMTTLPEDNVDDDSATLNGHFDTHGNGATVWFEYGTTTSFGKKTASINTTTNAGDYFSNISNLDECTTYYFRAVGENQYGRDEGQRLSFTTDCNTNDDLDVSTENVTDIDDTSATLNGEYDASGNLGTIKTWFEYGTSRSSLNKQTSTQSSSRTSDSISKFVSGLTPNTTYYVRFCASSSSTGTECGSIVDFSTSTNFSGNISVTTTVATSVGKYSANLNGYVTNNTGLSATTWFEYGTSANNFFQTTTFQTIGTTTSMPISAYVSGLTPNTTYYFRALAQTSNGIVTGNVESFRTQSAGSNIVYVAPAQAVATLEITATPLSVREDDCVTYVIIYKNISKSSLRNVSITVKLPESVDFTSSSSGTLFKDIGILKAGDMGVFTVMGTVNDIGRDREPLVTTATMNYTLSNGSQDSVIAYATQNLDKADESHSGSSFWGDGFFPSNILGWLILIFAILIIVYLIRRITYRDYYRDVPMPPR